MQVTSDINTLTDALSQCVTDKSMEIFKHALVEADSGQLSIRSNDSLTEVFVTVPATVKKKGQCTLDPVRLRGAMTGLLGDINLELKSKKVRAKHGKRVYTFDSHDPEDFPIMDDSLETEWKVDPLALKRGIEHVSHAAAKKDVRYYLEGVFIGRGDVAATNGHMLSVYPLEGTASEFVLPRQSLPAIVQALAMDEPRLYMMAHQGSDEPFALRIRADNYQITTRLLANGRAYPDYKRTIPDREDATCRMELVATEAVGSINRTVRADYEQKGERVGLDLVNGDLKITGKGSTDYVEVSNVEGEIENFGINSHYLAECLKHCDGDGKVRICLLDEKRQALIESIEGEARHTIMGIG